MLDRHRLPTSHVLQYDVRRISMLFIGSTSVILRTNFPELRQELLELLAKLKLEAEELAKTHDDQAQSIVGFTQMSTHEATRAAQDPQLLTLSTEGLRKSVTEFAKSHPKLAQIVNTISTTLSNSGI
jgi:hypothetical protein